MGSNAEKEFRTEKEFPFTLCAVVCSGKTNRTLYSLNGLQNDSKQRRYKGEDTSLFEKHSESTRESLKGFQGSSRSSVTESMVFLVKLALGKGSLVANA